MLTRIVIFCALLPFVGLIFLSERLDSNLMGKQNVPSNTEPLVISDANNCDCPDAETPSTAPYPGTDRRA